MSSSQERAASRTFVERRGRWSEEQCAAAAKAEKLIEERRLEVGRLAFPDQHGILRGKPVPFSTRHIYRDVLRRLADAGCDYMAGLEVEFHVFKLDNPRLDPADTGWPGAAPEVSMLAQGYQYLTETRFDQIEPILEIV